MAKIPKFRPEVKEPTLNDVQEAMKIFQREDVQDMLKMIFADQRVEAVLKYFYLLNEYEFRHALWVFAALMNQPRVQEHARPLLALIGSIDAVAKEENKKNSEE